MQDFIKKYKKHKLVSNISVIITSLLIAIGVNFILIDGTITGQELKASILNSNNLVVNSDIYLDLMDNKIQVKSSKTISDIKNLSLSIIYNPENIIINDISSINNIKKISNEKGIESIIINFDKTDKILPNEKILEINTSKISKVSENINMINANFSDINGKSYLLSTQGITF